MAWWSAAVCDLRRRRRRARGARPGTRQICHTRLGTQLVEARGRGPRSSAHPRLVLAWFNHGTTEVGHVLWFYERRGSALVDWGRARVDRARIDLKPRSGRGQRTQSRSVMSSKSSVCSGQSGSAARPVLVARSLLVPTAAHPYAVRALDAALGGALDEQLGDHVRGNPRKNVTSSIFDLSIPRPGAVLGPAGTSGT